MNSVYIHNNGISNLQEDIMFFIDSWVRKEKTPVPKLAIVARMLKHGEKDYTILHALNTLVRKGYIRRANISYTNKTHYVQLRSVYLR